MAGKNVFSPYWYRVASLRPRLRKHVQLHRHVYRGQTWHVLQDHTNGRFHRFSPAAYQLIGLMDGRHDMDQIWKHVSRELGEAALTQAQAIQLLAQLYKADALVTDVPPDTRELFERQSATTRRQRLQRWKSPLAIRIPLIDPDRFLLATLPLGRFFYSVWGMALWLLVVGSSAVLAFMHWPELTANLVDRVLAANNILILLLTFPLVKVLHEFGHAYAARRYGGEIHEMGIMFLILMPIPYVDATSSSAFASKWRRAQVAAAGMLMELFVAAIALHIWLNVDSGFLSAVMYNVLIIAGVSTLLFNANPLIRFDGYYILSDLIEIPNLGTRSTRYLGYLIQTWLFGVDGLTSPASTRGERWWLFSYAIASFIYRLFLITFIVMLLANKFFLVGVILAIWAFVTMAIKPIYRQIVFLMTNKRLQGKRTRAIGVSSAALAALVGVCLIPVPFATIVQGVVWADQDARVRMESQGFVVATPVQSGARVTAGQPLVILDNPEMTAQLRRLEAQRAELQARYDAVSGGDRSRQRRVQAELIRVQINAASANIARLEKQIAALTVRSPDAGIFVSSAERTLAGRFLQRGEVLGFILRPEPATVRVLVPQQRINLVRRHTESISVRVVDSVGRELPGRIAREVPRASESLPSAALALEGGGEIVTNPNSTTANAGRQLSAFRSWFQFDIEVARPEDELGLGERVYARFLHGSEPLGAQLYRSVRQTLLNQFNV